jgi:hypothetical protein
MPARGRSHTRPFARKGVIGLADSRRPAAAFAAHHSPPPDRVAFLMPPRVAIAFGTVNHKDTKHTKRE